MRRSRSTPIHDTRWNLGTHVIAGASTPANAE
jgi:hypothetical protein